MTVSKFRPSYTFTEERLEQLKAVVPEAFADGKINWDVLREALGEYLEDDESERFGLFWPGKRQARRLAAMPSKGALVPVPGEGVNEDVTRNIFIEGENLEVLKLLLKSYAGRVKMIYIDPPYNTGNDFIYSDDYAEPLEGYLKRTGQLGEHEELLTTNSRASGRFHSSWLNMIYPRLQLSRHLLREDGVIFVSIDDNEVHNLRQLMGEIFGEESFLGCFIWHRRQVPDNRNRDRASTDHEYILCYKNPEAILSGKNIDTTKYRNPDNDPRGPWYSDNLTGLATREQRPNLHYEIANPETGITYQPSPTRGWAISKQKFEEYIADNRILWPSSSKGRPRLKRFLSEASSLKTGFSTILNVGYTSDGTREIQEIFGQKVLQFPKPQSLMKDLIYQGTTGNGDLILDFFAGSCSTGHAVLEQNWEDGGTRAFIMVQLPEPVPPDSPASNMGLSTIAEIGKERIRRAIQKLAEEHPEKAKTREGRSILGFKVYKLARSNFREWRDYLGEDPREYQLQLAEMAQSPLVEGWKPEDLLAEVMLQQGFPLDSQVATLPEFGPNTVYRVQSDFHDFSLYICLDEQIQTQTAERLMSLPKEDIFICLDSALTDELKMRLDDALNLYVI